MSRLFFRVLAVMLIIGGIFGLFGIIGLISGVLDSESCAAWKDMAKTQGLKATLLEFGTSFTVHVLLSLVCLPIGLIILVASFTGSDEGEL